MPRGGTSRQYRTIYPRTSSATTDPAPTAIRGKAKTKRATVACSSCKHFRVKCCGDVPCKQCVHHGRVCSKDQTADGRRKVAIAKTQQDLTELKRFVEQFLGAIRTENMANVNHLIGVVRDGASQEEIIKVIQEFSESRISAKDTPKDQESERAHGEKPSDNEPANERPPNTVAESDDEETQRRRQNMPIRPAAGGHDA